MPTRSNFLKAFWFPGIFFGGLLFFGGYMAWKECSINNMLVKESLQGNRHAIAILAKYEKP